MPISCPACNKANQTDSTCARCGCDLTGLHEIVAAASVQLSAARTALAAYDWPRALAAAEDAWGLQHTADSAQLAFLAAAASGESARALRWHERAREKA